MHVTPNNLSESSKLIDFIINKSLELGADRVEFMGDLFHTHAVKRLEVEDFWYNAFDKITKNKISIICLVGNHDQMNSRELNYINALNIFNDKKGVKIINKPQLIDNIAYIPYMPNNELFISASKMLFTEGAKNTLVAHQTFTGATYDSGFYAEDGIDPIVISQNKIISGHIHTRQEIGKCLYIGTPKWDSLSDANEEKGIWLFNHDKSNGLIISSLFISTDNIVTPIKKYVITEGEKEDIELSQESKNYLELRGQTSWILNMKKKYKGLASIKATPLDRKYNKIEKNGLNTLTDYLNNNFTPISGVSKEDVLVYIKEFLSV